MSEPPPGASSRAYFDALGAGWDELRREFFPDHLRDRAIAAAGVESGRVAVDLGAGTGFLTEGLLARGIQVIAVDQSPVMLEALRVRFPSAGGLECRVGDAERLPIDDGAVDYCLANMYLHHVERPAVAIGEMARILKPGGVLVVTDLDAHGFTFLRDEHHDRWMGFERSEVREWLEAADFIDVQIDEAGDRCRASSAAGDEAAIGIFIVTGRRA